jgi:hypothetical protein
MASTFTMMMVDREIGTMKTCTTRSQDCLNDYFTATNVGEMGNEKDLTLQVRVHLSHACKTEQGMVSCWREGERGNEAIKEAGWCNLRVLASSISYKIII